MLAAGHGVNEDTHFEENEKVKLLRVLDCEARFMSLFSRFRKDMCSAKVEEFVLKERGRVGAAAITQGTTFLLNAVHM